MTCVDVVVVAYQSRDRLRDCVLPLVGLDGVRVIVADNASPDRGIETLADLDVTCLRLPRNGGFSYGCNAGWTAGAGTYVLFLNPDATLDAASLQALVAVLDADERVGAVAPQILDGDGHREPSLRRYPRLRSTYAQALFLHRVFRRAAWTDELVQDAAAYERPGSAEWVSGACMLLRRSALVELGRHRRRVLPLLRGHGHLQAARATTATTCATSRPRSPATPAAPRGRAPSCTASWPRAASATRASTAAGSRRRSSAPASSSAR